MVRHWMVGVRGLWIEVAPRLTTSKNLGMSGTTLKLNREGVTAEGMSTHKCLDRERHAESAQDGQRQRKGEEVLKYVSNLIPLNEIRSNENVWTLDQMTYKNCWPRF